MDPRIISFKLNCIMQLKQFYNIATKVSSRKKCYYFWWSTWLLRFSYMRVVLEWCFLKVSTLSYRSQAINCSDVIMISMASQITSLTIVYSTVYSGAVHRKHQSSASLAFVRGIHRWPVNSAQKGPGRRKMFPFDDIIMRQPKYWIYKMSHGL